MDVDLPRDYIFLAMDEDSDHEIHQIPVLIPSSMPEAEDEEHHLDEDEVMPDFDQLDDSEIEVDELMSDPDANDEDELMTESEEEENLEED